MEIVSKSIQVMKVSESLHRSVPDSSDARMQVKVKTGLSSRNLHQTHSGEGWIHGTDE